MNKVLVMLVIIIFFFGSQGKTDEKKGLIIDGYEWTGKPIWWKLGYISGWIEGSYENAMEFGVDVDRDPKVEVPSSEFIVKKLVGFYKKYGIDIGNISYGQIVDEIDKIYADPRVKQWEFKRIMPIVRGRLKGGWTEKDVDEAIAFYIKKDELSKNKMLTPAEFLKGLRNLDKQKPNVIKELETY